MNFLRFLVSRAFWINLAIAIALSVILYLVTFKLLNVFTRHGQAITLPNYIGLTVEELDNYAINKEFEFLIIDSLYDDSKTRGSIVMQDPLAHSQVKTGRKIYLTIVAKLPERVLMPDLKDYSLRQAVSLLETYGLKTGKLKFVQSDFENAVLGQMFNGDTLDGDTLILKGSKIDLIVGKGRSRIPVPFLIGMTRDEAIKTLNMASLNAGMVQYLDDMNPDHSRIYDQYPSYRSGTMLEMGARVDMWLRSDENFDFNKLIETIEKDTITLKTSDEEIDELELPDEDIIE